ncbi:cell division protein FtsZ [uncultured archaeon]|nr:cell division protein FtsZ [uncultured archaeon]HKJ96197.1 cell division protein FtsZ [Thermoplasmataceae archaeon]
MDDIVDLLFKSATSNAPDTGEEDNDFMFGPSSPEDAEIANVARQLRVRINILGCGGAGSNTISRLYKEKVSGADLIALNTDASHLYYITSPAKLLIGERSTLGRGTGAQPMLGEQAALEDISKIQKMVQKSDICFITCGLGGGTGTGSAPIIAKAAKEAGSLVISVVTLPFTAEGPVRMNNAILGLEKLSQYSDTVIAIPNDKLLQAVPKKPLEEAFEYADSVLSEAIKGITEMITKTGLINLDYADIKTIMKDGGVAMIGMGESAGGNDRVLFSLDDAISSPLVEADISQAKNCLIRVIGGPNMTVSEAEKAMSEIQKRIDKDARIIWGASIDQSYGDKIKVLILLTGVRSPYMLSGRNDARRLGKMMGGYVDDIGIDMIS